MRIVAVLRRPWAISRLVRRWVGGPGSVVLLATTVGASLAGAPRGHAAAAGSRGAAVMSVRSSSCSPLRPDPRVEQAVEDSNRSEDVWINQEGRNPPVDDVLPLLKDLGYEGDRALLIRGTGRTLADAVKGLLLQGYLDIPDCSYTSYGVSVLRNRTTNYFLAALAIAN